MRTYTKDFVVKDWNELTAKQQEEVKNRVYHDDLLINDYSSNESGLFDIYIDNLKDKYKDVYDDINLTWTMTGQGPSRGRGGWTVDANQSEWEKVDLSDVGIEGDVYVSIVRVVPDTYEYVLPDTYHMDLDFDYVDGEVTQDGEDVEYSSLFDVIENSKDGLDFLNKYADIYSEPLEKYWEICKEYASGFQDIEEWVESEMKEGYLRAVYYLDEDGNEVFEDFTWE